MNDDIKKNQMKRILFFLVSIGLLVSCENRDELNTRVSSSFNDGWKFLLLNENQKPTYDNQGWQNTDIPHDWSIESGFSETSKTGGRGGYFSGGIGWYLKTFQVPTEHIDKHAIIEFDGVYKDADIWVNDIHVGHHQHGYLSFFFDITSFISKDSTNTILVKVDNSDLPHDRWYSGAGIYRNVRLTYVPDVHIPVWGTYITTSQKSLDTAAVHIDIAVKNLAKNEVPVYIITEIIDANRKLVATHQSKTQTIKDSLNLRQNIDLTNVTQWSLSNPYMYQARHRVFVSDEEIDHYVTSFGIRNITYTKDGFFLNNEKVFLKGVNIHHDAGCEGSAVSNWTMYTRLKTLKEMGCNTIRLSHNPHAPELLNMCDTMGILVIAEAFDKWEVNSFTTPDGRWTVPLPAFGFKEHWKKYTTDFIKRDRNHPSVIMWSLGNEVVEAAEPLGVEVMSRLKRLVSDLEPGRPVTAAIQPPGHHPDLRPWEIAFNMDIVSYNYQSQFFKADKEKYDFIILGSETLPYYTRDNMKEIVHGGEHYLPVNSFFEAQKHAIGHLIWAGIDYFGEAVKPWPQKGWENAPINTAGFKKPFFYFLQSLYSDKPMAHIVVRDMTASGVVGKYGWDWPVVKSHWNWEHIEDSLQIQVYSNCEEIALYLNDTLVATNGKKDEKQGYFAFTAPYTKGALKAVGKTQWCTSLRTHIENSRYATCDKA
ncbi:MAG: glycoside hydrolase family 2 protein [Cyclobacteriaceae bacterium]|nr:glycoside hydrolase family 2 protein [Cyclobacteriaceae bacterium]